MHSCDFAFVRFRIRAIVWSLKKLLFKSSLKRNLKLFLYDLNIENSFLIEVFDNFRLFFQSSWCFWFVVIVMNNWKLEMIDVWRWKRQRDFEQLKSIVVYCRLSLCWVICSWNYFLSISSKFCEFEFAF